MEVCIDKPSNDFVCWKLKLNIFLKWKPSENGLPITFVSDLSHNPFWRPKKFLV